MASRIAAVTVLLLVSSLACSSRGAPLRHLSREALPQRYQHLQSPYRTSWHDAAPPVLAPIVSAPIPAPVHDLLGVDYYIDAQHSEIDPRLKAQNEAVEAPLRELGRTLMLLSDGYLRSHGQHPELARQTLEGLFSWASANALLGQVNRGGLNQVKWALGAYALDYLKIRESAGLDPQKRARVERWFRQLAAEQISYADQHPDWPDHANNHAYWAGMSVTAAGIAASDRTLFDWGITRFALFLEQVKPDGTLPLEMARGKRALHYHLFAAAPLVMLAELAEVNGQHLYSAGDHALARLVQRCLGGLANPSAFGRAAGAEQVLPGADDRAWLEIYASRFPAPEAARFLGPRPLVAGFLGGDLTLAFCKRAECR